MTQIRTILCPVDLTDVSAREVDLAVELARGFGARLVLHHNLPATGIGLAKSWEWKQAHPGAAADVPAEERMEKLVHRVPSDVPTEWLITGGPLAIGVARLAEQLPADLVLLGCHGCPTEEHSSLTEDLLGRCDRPLLVLHEDEERSWTLHLDERRQRPLRLLVPTDFTNGGTAAVRYACELARDLPSELHLLHVVQGSAAPITPIDFTGPATPYRQSARAEAEERLRDQVPPELTERVTIHTRTGTPDQVIVEVAESVQPDLIVMGEHARRLLRRFLTRDTARRVLHRAPCPVWFVPPPTMAA